MDRSTTRRRALSARRIRGHFVCTRPQRSPSENANQGIALGWRGRGAWAGCRPRDRRRTTRRTWSSPCGLRASGTRARAHGPRGPMTCTDSSRPVGKVGKLAVHFHANGLERAAGRVRTPAAGRGGNRRRARLRRARGSIAADGPRRCPRERGANFSSPYCAMTVASWSLVVLVDNVGRGQRLLDASIRMSRGASKRYEKPRSGRSS